MTRNPSPQPQEGQDIQVKATVANPSSSVTLTYVVNYGPEQSVPMTSGENGEKSHRSLTRSCTSGGYAMLSMLAHHHKAVALQSSFPAAKNTQRIVPHLTEEVHKLLGFTQQWSGLKVAKCPEIESQACERKLVTITTITILLL